MVARAYTVAFEGIEARLVEVQCAISPGIPAFSMVCYIEKPLLISSWFKITKADIGESRSEGLESLRFFDAGLSAGFRFGATVARVGKHD